MPYVVSEEEYVRAERLGMRLDSLLCPDCADPALCQAEGECAIEAAPSPIDDRLGWERPE